MYVPYFLRMGYSYSDPLLRAVQESSIAENDVDLYASNVAGVPILARSGALDTNVPPLHTRRLMRLIDEWNGCTHSIQYFKLM